jgi:hypothetical protein
LPRPAKWRDQPQERIDKNRRISRMKIGTSEHRELFCQTFVEGHIAYEPEMLPWPQLEQKYLDRLRAIPFWGIAKAMERKAGIMVSAFAQTLDDPAIREAVALQGAEEARHARLMAHFIERYGLTAREVDVRAGDPVKEQFVVFGYEECVDFFMGAGLFRLATKLDIFPADLVAIFDRVLVEEARHVTFFINWFRYEEARAGRDGTLGRHLTAIKNYFGSIKQLVRSFSGEETTGFVAASANQLVEGMTPVMFLEAALAENRRMLGLLDPRLIKPALLPTLAATALTVLRALPPRRENPAVPAAPAQPQAQSHSLNRSVAA